MDNTTKITKCSLCGDVGDHMRGSRCPLYKEFNDIYRRFLNGGGKMPPDNRKVICCVCKEGNHKEKICPLKDEFEKLRQRWREQKKKKEEAEIERIEKERQVKEAQLQAEIEKRVAEELKKKEVEEIRTRGADLESMKLPNVSQLLCLPPSPQSSVSSSGAFSKLEASLEGRKKSDMTDDVGTLFYTHNLGCDFLWCLMFDAYKQDRSRFSLAPRDETSQFLVYKKFAEQKGTKLVIHYKHGLLSHASHRPQQSINDFDDFHTIVRWRN